MNFYNKELIFCFNDIINLQAMLKRKLQLWIYPYISEFINILITYIAWTL